MVAREHAGSDGSSTSSVIPAPEIWRCANMTHVPPFESGEDRWIEGLAKLRNVIRQELIARQLGHLVVPGMSVLDVGCGQGTQALRLAKAGCRVVGLDPSPTLLGRFAHDAAAECVEVELLQGRVDQLDRVVSGRQFDLVCCHGVFMYLDDRPTVLASLVARLAPSGRLSATFRNAHALAMRPGMRRDWPGAIAAFESVNYVNELGVPATADRVEDIRRELTAVGFRIGEWFGVRIFNDAIPADMAVPEDEDLELLFEAEELAGKSDPYRWMASQLHIIAEREAL